MTHAAHVNTFEWFPMTPRDWLDGTRDLTPEQRGIYIDLICLQMLHQRPVRIDQKKDGSDDFGWLAHQLHVSTRKAASIVHHLVENMKMRRLENGLSNVRCEFELEKRAKVSRKNSENITNYWRKVRETQKKPNEINEEPIRPNDSGIYQTDTKKIPIREIEIEREDSPRVDSLSNTTNSLPPETYADLKIGACTEKLAKKTKKTYTAEFLEFWKRFPVKEGKWAAYSKSWKKLTAAEKSEATVGAELYADRVAAEKIDKPKWAQGWLTDKRWQDEIERSRGKTEASYWWQDPEKLAEMTDERWRAGIAKLAGDIWPVPQLGPPPGSDQCVVPSHLVAELSLTKIYDEHGIRRQ